MDVIEDVATFRVACEDVRRAGRTLGFVPTMGALHDGHASLLRAARENGEVVAMSIFVNPLQFGPGEDLAAYPRDLEQDLKLAEREGVGIVFAPGARSMYPDGAPRATVDPGPVGEILEGAIRPGHFRGVCMVVTKLFSIAGPCRAYFGEKDFQQLFIVRSMARDLDLPAEVVGLPTVREPDGLALSSRNAHLSADERRAARCLFRALEQAVRAAVLGERKAAAIARAMIEVVEAEPLAALDYATVVEEATFAEPEVLPEPAARALIAARIGATRLIDNMPLPPSMKENP